MENSKKQITCMMNEQTLAVLSTYNAEFEQPYGTIIAFYNSDNLKNIFFATPKATRKYANLLKCPKVSVLIDTRKNDGADIGVSAALTALGTAREITVNNDNILGAFLDKHPQLKSFLESPSTALFSVEVHKYILVNRFQDVTELDMT